MLDGKIRAAHTAGELDGLHGVLIVFRGETLAETYFPGKDEAWGRPLGVVEHGPETLHDLRSVSKSVVSLVYGIALAEGKVPPVDAVLVDSFPQYPDLAADPARRKITVADALSMQMGTAWNEDLPYSDPHNSEIAMEMAPDRYRFALDRPMVTEPGMQWTYNGGATALIARLIADGTGMPVDAYAAEKLFRPLGIKHFEWAHGDDGEPAAASGLRLTLRDLARIGRMVIDNGRYGGRQVVPADWLAASFTPRADIEGGQLRYGWFWWLADRGDPPVWVAGFGNGGQRITIQPAIDLMIVVSAGNYNEPDAWRIPVRLIERFMVPAVRALMPVK